MSGPIWVKRKTTFQFLKIVVYLCVIVFIKTGDITYTLIQISLTSKKYSNRNISVQFYNGDWNRYQIHLKLFCLSDKFETFLEETVEFMVLNWPYELKSFSTVIQSNFIDDYRIDQFHVEIDLQFSFQSSKKCFFHHSFKWFDHLECENWQIFDQTKLMSIWIRWYLTLKNEFFYCSLVNWSSSYCTIL